MLVNLERAHERLKRDRLDAWVCVLPKHVYYLSDYESDWLFDLPWASAAILPARTDIAPTLIVHDVELTNLAERPSWMPVTTPYLARIDGTPLTHYSAGEDARLTALEQRVLDEELRCAKQSESSCLDATIAVLRAYGLDRGRVGFDDLRFRDACCSVLPHLVGVDALKALQWTRHVKTLEEQGILREAARRNQTAIAAALAAAREGALWSEVRRAYGVAVAQADCAPAAFYVGAGRKSMGLWADHDYPILRHEPICIDAMLTYRRYHGDAQRTAVIGEPTDKLARYWEAVSSAAAECYGEMRAGVNTGVLRERAQRVVRALGIPHFRHAFVHGLGLDHLELPGEGHEFSAFDLETGMVVNMDLEVCELGFGGIYFEQSMLIGDHGAECLYSMPRELVRLT